MGGCFSRPHYVLRHISLSTKAFFSLWVLFFARAFPPRSVTFCLDPSPAHIWSPEGADAGPVYHPVRSSWRLSPAGLRCHPRRLPAHPLSSRIGIIADDLSSFFLFFQKVRIGAVTMITLTIPSSTLNWSLTSRLRYQAIIVVSFAGVGGWWLFPGPHHVLRHFSLRT